VVFPTMEIMMNTPQKSTPGHSHERTPTHPQRDDDKQHPGQAKPGKQDQEDQHDRDHRAPHRK
jgi:hypothetical protein